MPNYIIKIRDHYLEWSTVSDAPETFGMTLTEFRDYYRDEYGRASMDSLDKRLSRVEQNGVSALNYKSVADLIRTNRAGPSESTLTIDEIYEAYCLRRPIRDGWLPR